MGNQKPPIPGIRYSRMADWAHMQLGYKVWDRPIIMAFYLFRLAAFEQLCVAALFSSNGYLAPRDEDRKLTRNRFLRRF